MQVYHWGQGWQVWSAKLNPRIKRIKASQRRSHTAAGVFAGMVVPFLVYSWVSMQYEITPTP